MTPSKMMSDITNQRQQNNNNSIRMKDSSNSTTRRERSSFRGMTILEGERSLEPASAPSTNSNEGFQLYKQRNERRRRSSSLAQNPQIRDIIAKTVEELAQKDNKDGLTYKTAEDRLKEVLAEAKESGHSAEKIFSVFKSEAGSSGELFVSKQDFIEGLEELGYKITSDEELEYIADRFDLNNDGLISMSEFQHYCYYEVSPHSPVDCYSQLSFFLSLPYNDLHLRLSSGSVCGMESREAANGKGCRCVETNTGNSSRCVWQC